MEENPLYSNFKERKMSEAEYAQLPRFNAQERLERVFGDNPLAQAVSRQLNSASRVTEQQWEWASSYLQRYRNIDITSDEGRKVIREITDFISTRE